MRRDPRRPDRERAVRPRGRGLHRATGARPGRFELADGGTLLLDEIGEVSLPLQAKLLRVLEDGVVQRVGGTGETRVRVRVLAATNRDLAAEVRRGHFRQDLYYRLDVFPIRIPPLRERPEDLIPLAEHFLARLAAERGASPPRFDARARSALLAYDWPGNVRELRNLVQRAFLLCEGDEIPSALIEPWLGGEPAGDDLGRWRPEGDPIGPLVGRRLRDVEDALILATLEREGGNRTRAAAVLGVSPRTLYNRLQQLAPAG
ncbi:MAG: sigma 54-interacting transcriptional regulator [Planctomycetota bacterium]